MSKTFSDIVKLQVWLIVIYDKLMGIQFREYVHIDQLYTTN